MKMLDDVRPELFTSTIDSAHRARWSALLERARVFLHLDGAEHAIRSRAQHLSPPRRLAPLARLNRRLLLDELRAYKNRGIYPLNRIHSGGRVPQFIDARGTRCAMAHLIEISGFGDLVQTIARTENDARVATLARHDAVRAWLSAAGLSMEEAARIQPTYCFVTEAEACFCNQGNVPSIMLGTVLSIDPEGVATVRIDRREIGGGGAGGYEGAIGDEVRVELNAAVGEQVLLAEVDYGVGYRGVSQHLSIEHDQVFCSVNDFTAARPVSVETAIAALSAEGYDCIEVLKNDDSEWNESQCRGGYGEYDDDSGDGDGDTSTTGDGDGDMSTTGDGDGDMSTTGDGDGDMSTTGDGDGMNMSQKSDGGCALSSQVHADGAPAITSMAILVALLARRGLRVVRGS